MLATSVLPNQVKRHYDKLKIEDSATEGVYFGVDKVDGKDYIQIDFKNGRYDVWKFLPNPNYRRNFDPRLGPVPEGEKQEFKFYWKISETGIWDDDTEDEESGQ